MVPAAAAPAPLPPRPEPTRPAAPGPSRNKPPVKTSPARRRMSQKTARAIANSAQLVKDPDHRNNHQWHLVAADGTVIAHVERSYGGASRSGQNGWHGWPHGMMRTTERHQTRELAAQYAAAAWVRVATAPPRTKD
jgi:hypothetical protein